MRVIGLDLSLTATGVATEEGARTIVPGRLTGMPRLRAIRNEILDVVLWIGGPPPLVVIEGYAFSSRSSHAHALGELGGIVRLALFENGVRYVDVPPANLKRLACGKGNAPKEAVLAAAIRRLGYTGSDHNQADAMWLREAALQHYRLSSIELPKTHLEALAKISWPVLERKAVA